MERYEIFITDKTEEKKTGVSGEDKETKKSNVAGEDDKEKEKEAKKESRATAKIIAKTTIGEVKSLIVPRIGEYARNSLLQQKIDDTMGLVDTAISMAINPVYGLLNLSTKQVSNLITYTINNEKEQTRLSVALRRASYINRSRD